MQGDFRLNSSSKLASSVTLSFCGACKDALFFSCALIVIRSSPTSLFYLISEGCLLNLFSLCWTGTRLPLKVTWMVTGSVYPSRSTTLDFYTNSLSLSDSSQIPTCTFGSATTETPGASGLFLTSSLL